MTKHTGTALKHLELHEEHELTKFENLQKRMRSWFSKKANIYFTEIEIIHTFIDMLVLLSIAQLYVSVTYPEDTTWVLIGLFILGCFTVEVVVKMTAFGPKKYLSYGEHNWTRFVWVQVSYFSSMRAFRIQTVELYTILPWRFARSES